MAQTDAMVYVVHGILGTDLGLDAALPVDIRVGDTCAVENASFQQIAGPFALPAGLYTLISQVLTPTSSEGSRR
jgi:hypothetical protein